MEKNKTEFKITLIVPCYNEVKNIQKGVLDKIGNFTASNVRFNEVLIIDDGSTDASCDMINEKYLPLFPKFKLIKNNHLGKAFAIMDGVQRARSEYVMFTDIDLATPIEESEKLMRGIEENYDIIIGSRSSSREGAPFTRKLMAYGMILVREYFIGLKGIKDAQCGFKIFRTKTALHIISHLQVFSHKPDRTGSSVSAGFDLEFLYLAYKMGYTIKEVPVIWRHVETKNVTFVSSSLEGLKDIFQIKWYDLQKKYPR